MQRIAIDAELLYDGMRNPGIADMLTGIYALNTNNKIYILAETEQEAKRIAYMTDTDGFIIAEQRTWFSEVIDVYFARRDSIGKTNAKVTIRQQ